MLILIPGNTLVFQSIQICIRSLHLNITWKKHIPHPDPFRHLWTSCFYRGYPIRKKGKHFRGPSNNEHSYPTWFQRFDFIDDSNGHRVMTIYTVWETTARQFAKGEWKFRVASNSCKASRNLKTLATITGLQL